MCPTRSEMGEGAGVLWIIAIWPIRIGGASGVDVECTMPSRGWGERCREDTYTLPDSYDATCHSPEVA